MPRKPLKVKKWIRNGNLGTRLKTQAEILEDCGRALDRACTHEILGDVLFQATDGKHYVVTVEAIISRCNPSYLADVLAEEEGQ